MSIDFAKPPHIVVVHGVQTGEDEDIGSEDQVRALVKQALAQNHVERDFRVKGYFYENINNDAQKLYRTVARALTAGKPLAGKALDTLIDLVGDVVAAARNTSTAAKIRKGLKRKILDSYRAGHQVALVAHSLGTVYSLDVINSLIASRHYFHGDDARTWPVQGFVSMGSPLGLDLDIMGVPIFEKRKIETIPGADYRLFPWDNYYNRLDPVVSGSVFGSPVDIDAAKGPVEQRYGPSVHSSNWLLRPHVVTSGNQWLSAHTAYWRNPSVGDRLLALLWG